MVRHWSMGSWPRVAEKRAPKHHGRAADLQARSCTAMAGESTAVSAVNGTRAQMSADNMCKGNRNKRGQRSWQCATTEE